MLSIDDGGLGIAKLKDMIWSLVKLPLGFSLMTNILLVMTVLFHIVPCLIYMPEIAPPPIGSGNYFPGTMYSDLKNYLFLFLSLYVFREADRNTALQQISPQLATGMIYGVYLSFVYIGVTFLRRGIMLFGFSYGPQGWGLIYYLTALMLLFRHLNKKLSPWQSLTASFFTVFMSSVLWEVPYYMWRAEWVPTHYYRLFGRIVILSLIPLAYKTFGSKTTTKHFIALFTVLVVLNAAAGLPAKGLSGPALGTNPNTDFTLFDSVRFVSLTMASRIAAFLGLSFGLWSRESFAPFLRSLLK